MNEVKACSIEYLDSLGYERLLKPSDTFYWELKSLKQRCEDFVNAVYDDYSEETIIEFFNEALQTMKEKSNGSPEK